MEEVRLKVRKRAFPSHGRARLHSTLLSKLGAEEGSKLVISNESKGTSVTVTLFADSMVEEGYIRLSPEDLTALGLIEEDMVIISKKPPISQEVRERAARTADQVSERIERAGETVRKEAGKAREETIQAAGAVKGEVAKAYGKFVEETAPIADRIGDATRGTVSRLKEEVLPVTERVEDAARDTYQKIAKELPVRERLSKTTESVMDRLKPSEEEKLTRALEECKGNIRAVTITSDAVADKLVKDIDLPKEVVIAAIQRNKEIVIPKGDTRVVKGDIAFLVGKEDSLQECTRILEG
jgi:gas vesicle protein